MDSQDFYNLTAIQAPLPKFSELELKVSIAGAVCSHLTPNESPAIMTNP